MTEAPIDKSATDSASLVARLGDVVALDLTVAARHQVSPSMLALTFTGDALDGFTYLPGQDIMIATPSDDGSIFRRRYTIAGFDHGAKTLTIEVFLHGGGPGETWAKGAAVGDRVDAVGPRGKQPVVAGAQHHLFVSDQCALPATRAMAESVTEGSVTCVVALETLDDASPIVFGTGVDGRVVELVGASDHAVLDAVAEVELRDATHAYLNCEFNLMGALKASLLARGLGGEQISIKPYWRRGLANAAHGEPVKS